MDFYATIFSLLPPIIAIALALITKEVYSSLFIGIFVGGLLFTEGSIEQYAEMTNYAMSFARDGKGVAPLMTFDGELLQGTGLKQLAVEGHEDGTLAVGASLIHSAAARGGQ